MKFFSVLHWSKGFWMVRLNDIAANGKALNLCENKFCRGLFASGTSVLGGDRRLVEKLL